MNSNLLGYYALSIFNSLPTFRDSLSVLSLRVEYILDPYTGCPGRNVPDFGRMFLKLKYTDITQNTYIQS